MRQSPTEPSAEAPAAQPSPARKPSPVFEVSRGHPLPLGASVRPEGVNFAVFSRIARTVSLVLYEPGEREPMCEIPLDPTLHRTGDVFHILVQGLDPATEYGYRVERIEDMFRSELVRRRRVLIDPYARRLSGKERWGEPSRHGGEEAPEASVWRSVPVPENHDWGKDRPPHTHLADTIIYELHVRGFTRHPSSGCVAPGTFEGVVEKIPYLRELGVTAVELMPITEYNENDNRRRDPESGEALRNYWGYHPISFFAPKASYSSGDPLRAFRTMVQKLHEAGIEVILDMVFNHTGEGEIDDPTHCYRGLDDEVYYLHDPKTGEYRNYSGCGNTLNCNHPVVREMIHDALRYWVTEMHVDGFRFDLASILGRGEDGEVLSNPPLLEAIAADPVLANTKLIAEAWDAAGLYQVGTFPNFGRWAEWNGRFRDDLRRFLRGEDGMVPALATRLAGSSDLYQDGGRAPYHSINFVTCHDGYTLADLVSYEQKHNERNGEQNRDGCGINLSWNCGCEGPSANPEILLLRRRQQRNFAALLLLSQGVPMLLAGDELGRTQQGNNNAYCQDNPTSWIDWELAATNHGLLRFFRRLIQFRKAHPSLRRRNFVRGTDNAYPPILWHGPHGGHADWSPGSHRLAMYLRGGFWDDEIYVIANASGERVDWSLPTLPLGRQWHLFMDTARPSPGDIAEVGAEPVLESPHHHWIAPHSVVVLVGR